MRSHQSKNQLFYCDSVIKLEMVSITCNKLQDSKSYSTVQKSELISLYDGSKAVHERSQFCVSPNKVNEQVTGNYDHIHVQEYSDIIRTGNYPLISSN